MWLSLVRTSSLEKSDINECKCDFHLWEQVSLEKSGINECKCDFHLWEQVVWKNNT